MLAGSRDSVSDLISFKSLWSSFARNAHNLLERAEVRPEDESSFLDAKRRVVERCQQLTAEGPEMPQPLAEMIRSLGSFNAIASLSDSELDDLRHTIETADSQIDVWINKARRKDVYREGIEKKARVERLKIFIGVPIFFIAILAIFVFLGLTFFLNR